ncbi:hypothetical protein [Edwardsiella phage vB_EtaM_ET-ABTNL-9]|nr:hypothetical protein [Edwardsiella phage vB_EtaM_ET-ABTNL-9]
MDKERIKKMALGSGFKLKEQPNGEMDLNPYVYEFVDMVESAISHKYKSERKDKWISVEDRLPEKYGEYLTYNGREYSIQKYNENGWLNLYDAILILYWQNLPEIPEEVRND